jgi:hypothetical protein
MNEIKLRYLQGRNQNGAHRDAGFRIHGILGESYKALCGAKPSRLSGGWAPPWQDEPKVDCPRCAKKVERINAMSPLYKCLGCSTLINNDGWCEECNKKAVLSMASAITSTQRKLNPPPEPTLSKIPPENPFLRTLWEAANGIQPK